MKTQRSWLTSIIMIPVACLVGMPLYYVLVNTFKTQEETTSAPLALPQSLSLDNYVSVFESVPLLQSLFNTAIVTAASVGLMLLIGSMGAYALMLKTRFNKIIASVVMLAFIVPFQTTLIPLYQMLVNLSLVDSRTGLIVLYSGGSIFCYFLIQGYMKTLPMEILEAAQIDGAGPFTIYWKIVLPLIRPILVTVGVFQVMGVWNDFITPNVFISSPEKQTLVLQVYTAVSQYTTDWPLFMTLTVIVLIPMVIFFIFMQKHIVSGLVHGSVKG